MSGLIDMMKSNLGITLDIVIAIVAVVVIAWAFLFSAPAVRDEIKSVERDVRQLRNLQQANIVVPSVDPNQEDEQLTNLTINPTIIQQMRKLASSIDSELIKIRDFAEQRNRQNHDWLINGLFPKPVSADRPHNARDRYLDGLQRLLGKPTATQVGLDAGMPPSPDVIKEAVDRVKNNMMADKQNAMIGSTSTYKPSEAETKQILAAMRNEHMELLKRRAASIHLYAETDPNSSGYPFSLVPISPRPELDELWEAQIQFWIISDICRAISMINDTESATSSVIQSPVKRLIQLAVLPGYIGVHVPGYVKINTAESGSTSASRGDNNTTTLFDKPVGMSNQPPVPDEEGTEPAKHEQIRTPDNFFITPTGRTSNLLYDVRHVRLRAVVDFQQLPKLLEAINKINFMTILSVEMSDVDEYDALQQGYLYGPGDMVEVNMIIESIWLRSWTLENMPDLVKISLGLIRVEGEKTDAKEFQNVWGTEAGQDWDSMY